MTATARPNTISIHERDYVLACVGGAAVHLVAQPPAGDPARSIVDRADAVLNPAYDPSELSAPSWSERTLCGRDQWFMAPTEAGRAFESMWNGREEAVAVPSCKRCLRILDKQFPSPEPDDRLAWNVMRAIAEVLRTLPVHRHAVFWRLGQTHGTDHPLGPKPKVPTLRPAPRALPD